MKIQFFFLCLLFSLFFACSPKTPARITATKNRTISIDQLKPVIQQRGKIWGQALTSKNIDLLKELYDKDAHYLPNDSQAFHGRDAIINYWQASFDFLGDLKLNMESLEGTKELLYETGNGTVKVMGQDGQFFDMPFKYVNIWKRQPNGIYKVVVDTFNNLPNE